MKGKKIRDVAPGDIVVFNSRDDAAQFRVLTVDGFALTVAPVGLENPEPQPSDRDLVNRCFEAEAAL